MRAVGLVSLLGLLPAATCLGGVVKSFSSCTVIANGNRTDDVPNILKAFDACNNGGTVVFPQDQNYWIGTRLNPVIQNVIVEWRGIWTVGLLFSYSHQRIVYMYPRKDHSSQQLANELHGPSIDSYHLALRQPRLLAHQLLPYRLPKPRCRLRHHRLQHHDQRLRHRRHQRQRQRLVRRRASRHPNRAPHALCLLER